MITRPKPLTRSCNIAVPVEPNSSQAQTKDIPNGKPRSGQRRPSIRPGVLPVLISGLPLVDFNIQTLGFGKYKTWSYKYKDTISKMVVFGAELRWLRKSSDKKLKWCTNLQKCAKSWIVAEKCFYRWYFSLKIQACVLKSVVCGLKVVWRLYSILLWQVKHACISLYSVLST